ncbi:hypothetical protein ADU80_03560 [Clostridium botulinum]|uniref:Yip1 domain-containing protein n=1 Tax=Clostridium botulinum TaxID=1491 RepID=A0A9Q1V0H5_CLOBO|nr:YIP1 family protein [Clostridium botulinum]AEB75301.1 hypothetical protein CbC4_0621 [Clostridium botulinum BKT015925]KEI04587.1 hypothetical protein Y848_01245 [Clostridium botulinum C/D str. Sp77]KOA76187.1 hypothetical protein ADU77_09505 [Clostridium botulinum]KOA86844.1 hypothetical protein ADU75_05240 [Clostridium botulinum]KOA87134.1 hypothetical protein ADU80_03560 [Clostridium botulinum]
MNKEKKFFYSPWITIWTKPRETIKNLKDNTSEIIILLLSILGSVSIELYFKELTEVEILSGGIKSIILECIRNGIITGIVSIYLSGKIFHILGKHMGAIASFKEIRVTLAWSQVPLIYALILHVIKIAIFKQEIFMASSEIIDGSMLLAVLIRLFIILDIVIGIKQLIIFLKCISEVQGFKEEDGLGKAAKCTLISFAIWICTIGMMISVLSVIFS